MIDLAALRVKEKTKLPLPAMSLGHSEVVKTGDWTIVLGIFAFLANLFFFANPLANLAVESLGGLMPSVTTALLRNFA